MTWQTELAATGIEDPAAARDWLEAHSEDWELFRADRTDDDVWAALYEWLDHLTRGPRTAAGTGRRGPRQRAAERRIRKAKTPPGGRG